MAIRLNPELPREWGFANYHADEDTVRNYLERNNAKSTAIPHRSNRAILLDSNLFHATDRMDFRGAIETGELISHCYMAGQRKIGTSWRQLTTF